MKRRFITAGSFSCYGGSLRKKCRIQKLNVSNNTTLDVRKARPSFFLCFGRRPLLPQAAPFKINLSRDRLRQFMLLRAIEARSSPSAQGPFRPLWDGAVTKADDDEIIYVSCTKRSAELRVSSSFSPKRQAGSKTQLCCRYCELEG